MEKGNIYMYGQIVKEDEIFLMTHKPARLGWWSLKYQDTKELFQFSSLPEGMAGFFDPPCPHPPAWISKTARPSSQLDFQDEKCAGCASLEVIFTSLIQYDE